MLLPPRGSFVPFTGLQVVINVDPYLSSSHSCLDLVGKMPPKYYPQRILLSNTLYLFPAVPLCAHRRTSGPPTVPNPNMATKWRLQEGPCNRNLNLSDIGERKDVLASTDDDSTLLAFLGASTHPSRRHWNALTVQGIQNLTSI